jgi:hypothetical protein
LNIKPQMKRLPVNLLFTFREKINQKGSESRLLELLGDEPVPRAVASAAAAMGEQN